MTRFKAAAVGTLAMVLAAAPLTSALANGNGQHYGHGHHYWNPLYPVVGLAAAVVGTAAAIVTLPFQIIGAAAAQAPYYGPPPQGYAPQQGYGGPGYAAPQAYYPAPAVSYGPPAASYYYGPSAPYYPPRAAVHGGYRGHDGYAANAGYYRPMVDRMVDPTADRRAATTRRARQRTAPPTGITRAPTTTTPTRAKGSRSSRAVA
jgi:hypothetical protein